MSSYSHNLKVGDVCVLFGLGDRWDGTRMEVMKLDTRVEGCISYVHPINHHTYRLGSSLRIQHANCKLAEGEPPSLPDPPKIGDFAEVINGSSSLLGLQIQVTELKADNVTRGIIVYKPSGSTRRIGSRASFYNHDLRVISIVKKPRKIFSESGGWGP